MNKIKIITDSTCDLSPELIKKHDIEVLPLYVNFSESNGLPEQSLRDGVDVNTEGLYELVEKYGKLPKTAAVTIQTFMDVFTKYVEEGYDVIYTGISKQMSSTYNNAKLACNEVGPDHISVIDSMNLSTGIGLNLLRIAKLRDQGKSLEEITNDIKVYRTKVRSQFVIPTLDYLYKGGRCSALSAFFGKAFKIKPIIEVRDGKMGVGKKTRGKIQNGLDAQVEMLKADLKDLECENIFITHSLADEECAYLVNALKEILPKNMNIYTTCAGCVISSHCGKGTIGILYTLK